MSDSSLTLVILAAGRSRRYGRLKQLDPMGPGGSALLDYAIYDGVQAGFGRFVIVIAPGMEPEFDNHLSRARARGVAIELAVQEDAEAAPGLARERPWGTGFALLSARGSVSSDFGVCNADDFYGRGAVKDLADALTSSESDALLVPFPLAETLSARGGVSRGLCRTSSEGRLVEVVEGLDLTRAPDGAVRGRDPRGRLLEVGDDTPVSMNLWGFRSTLWPLLSVAFGSFIKADPGPEDEFYLSEFVNDAVQSGTLECQVLRPGHGWLGVTFPGDRAAAAESLAQRTNKGLYPPRLWDPSQPRKGGDACS
ncbi:MAG: NTP transferase domain-containing protein [Gemmatimonadetes bacterium]|nr:NTP transferase domain-containing protein [Gemmatimonadota bacterium]